MGARTKVLLVTAGLALGLVVLGVGCGAEATATPVATSTPTMVPQTVPTVTPPPGATVAPTATPKPTPTTSTHAPIAGPVVLRASTYFWNVNHPIKGHWGSMIHALNFDRLNWISVQGELIPQMATSWELVDDTTWRFTLRDDLKFHDGTPVTAHDVKFTMDAHLNWPGSAFRDWKTWTGVELVDDYTIEIKTASIDVSVPRQLYSTHTVSKNQVDTEGWEGFEEAPLGSGPWRWVEWVANDHTFADRVPGDHPYREAHTDRIELYNVPQPTTAAAALRTGAIDYAVTSFFPEQAQLLERKGFNVWPASSTQAQIWLNTMDACRLGRPTCDVRVRQALAMSIDREIMARELWGGYAAPVSQPGVPDNPGYDHAIAIKYDPVEAERLLDDAGYLRGPDGVRFELDFMSWLQGVPELMALSMIDMWGKVGVKVNYSFTELGVVLLYTTRSDGREMPPLFFAQAEGVFGDNTWNITHLCNDPKGKQCSNPYDNVEFYSLQAQIAAEPDPDKRTELVKKAMRVLVDDPPIIWTTMMPKIHVYSAKWEGFAADPSGFPVFDGIRLVS